MLENIQIVWILFSTNGTKSRENLNYINQALITFSTVDN